MNPHDKRILRDLAWHVAEAAAQPEMEQRRQEWYRHNALQPGKPLIFCSPEGAWVELLPDTVLQCQEEEARGWEWGLRMRLYAWEHFADDEVLDDEMSVGVCLVNTGWGLDPEYERTAERGASRWEGRLQDAADLEKLTPPTTQVDEAATERRLAEVHEVFDGILHVTRRNVHWWGISLIGEYARLRGLEQILLDMAMQPEFAHETMSLLQAGRLAWLDSLESQDLLALNNGNDYVGSGGFGFTCELPSQGFDPEHVRTRDLWGFAENQEGGTISPRMFEEFVLRYQLPILERFGLNCYACCEPVHDRLDVILQIPRLRRLSISPWTDREIAAEKLGDRVIYSWKPNPARLAGVGFDEDLVRREIRETIQITQGCRLEIVLKDTHTCQGQPERFDRWVRIAREEVDRV
ncbi:MAG: hypothetical protein GX100_07885 [candidate division WS1 bacterium]|nr:hypothetical protein [candidate division WS1 bacterium]